MRGVKAIIPLRPLAALVHEALPQTQCRRCGFDDCAAYAHAVADTAEAINRCPPGGQAGVDRLAALTARPRLPLDEQCGVEGPRLLAVIDEAWCIGCTLCLDACPVDAIVGAAKQMHSIIDAQCTGCELCVPACPVDCISLQPQTPGLTGWAAWSPAQANEARDRYAWHEFRRERARRENDDRLAAKARSKLAELEAASRSGAHEDPALARKRDLVAAAIERARARRAENSGGVTTPQSAAGSDVR
jgi:Na+-translocating ferredoxin:NAD+ oxidoreductase subunit B